ncbi:MAG: ATP-grasp domain-containing protein [Deltaproteobacteria bacterium]|nr:ATP-grasp domain-containing protein [Deltaproteobacteria bacterium]
MRVVVTHNVAEEPGEPPGSLEPIRRALELLGHNAELLPITYDTLPGIERIEADFVLNLCDGSGIDGCPGLEVLAALERLRLPYSGAGPRFYAASSGKWRMKRAFASRSIPVPRGAVMPSTQVALPSGLRYPLIVKPRHGYGSIGLDDASVVHELSALRCAIERVADSGDDAFVEEYVEGREITVAIVGPWRRPVVLPPLEIRFGAAFDGGPAIRSFASKYDEASELYHGFDTLCPAPLEPAVEARVKQVARRAYAALAGSGYGRVDIRLSASGEPFVLEVNANPSLEIGPDPVDCATFPLIAFGHGWSAERLLAELIEVGLRRTAEPSFPRYAPRRSGGRLTAHALCAIDTGAFVAPFGPVYPLLRTRRPRPTLPGIVQTRTGQDIVVEPHVRALNASDPANTRLDAEGRAIVASRRIEADEALSFDFSTPIGLASRARRPPVLGRRRGAVNRGSGRVAADLE